MGCMLEQSFNLDQNLGPLRNRLLVNQKLIFILTNIILYHIQNISKIISQPRFSPTFSSFSFLLPLFVDNCTNIVSFLINDDDKYIYYQMLVVKNIKIQYDKLCIPVRIRTLNVGYKKDTRQAVRKYTQMDSHTFIWNQDITLPLYYNVPLKIKGTADDIQYNPEDPNSQLSCSMKIIDYKGHTQTGNLLNLENKLMATVTVTYRVANEQQVIPEEKGIAVISSILAHLNHQKGTNGYIEISMGYKEIYTPTVNFVAGELLWGDQLILPVEELKDKYKREKYKLTFTIFIDDQPRGQGICFFEPTPKTNIKYKKVDIVDVNNKDNKIGIVFIDMMFRDRSYLERDASSNGDNRKSKYLQNPLQKKKNTTDLLLVSRQNSQNFFNIKSPMTVRKQKPPTPMRSSRSENKLQPHNYNSDKTAKILQKYQQKKNNNKKIEDVNFDGIFRIGEFSNEQNIRRLLKERRKKQKESLPKLK